MQSKRLNRITIVISSILITACASNNHRDLTSFTGNAGCYNRLTEPYTSMVDSHLHFRPFGGPAIPFAELNDYFRKTGILFVNIYGIGQVLPVDSSCTYYLDCPGTPALPSIKNDFVNAASYLENKPQDTHFTLSMTFPDLANPADIVNMIHLYDKEYPKMFRWMGEVNLVKQALFKNQHAPATVENIKQWSEFMALLRERDIPINIHSDLGNDAEPKKFLPLMAVVLELYPNNKIVWAHMGLSKELSTMKAEEHIQIMKSFLDKYPNLMLDISWRVIYDNYFSKQESRTLYIAFLNDYSNRILPGTDFVAARNKQFEVYKEELEVTSRINQYLNNEAFRNIALGGNYFRLLGLKYQAPRICN
jgi:hypothetical protein